MLIDPLLIYLTDNFFSHLFQFLSIYQHTYNLSDPLVHLMSCLGYCF